MGTGLKVLLAFGGLVVVGGVVYAVHKSQGGGSTTSSLHDATTTRIGGRAGAPINNTGGHPAIPRNRK